MRNCKNSENVPLLAEKQNVFWKSVFPGREPESVLTNCKKKLSKLCQTVKDISFLTKKQTVFWQLQKQFQTVKHIFPDRKYFKKPVPNCEKYIFPDRETESILKNCKVCFKLRNIYVYIVPGKETVSILKNCKSCFKQWTHIYLTESVFKVTKTVSNEKIIAHCTCNVPLRLCAKCAKCDLKGEASI